MPYQKNPTWVDGPAGLTPITAAKLNNIEDGIAGSTPRAQYPVIGRLIQPLGVTEGQSPVAPPSVLNHCIWIPMFLTYPAVLESLQTYCWLGEAGAKLRVGFYNMSATFRPTTLIADAGLIPGDTTGVKTLASTQTLPIAFMLAIWNSNHATARWSFCNTDANALYGFSSPTNGYEPFCIAAADYSAGLPATAPAAEPARQALYPRQPHVWMKFGAIA